LPERFRSGASLNADDPSTYYGGGAKGYTATIQPLPESGARNRTSALTKGGDNPDVLPETFQVLRSSPTGTVSCREPSADCQPGWTATPVTLLLAILFVARKAKKGDCGHLAAERLT
jgi:hypothetical protein